VGRRDYKILSFFRHSDTAYFLTVISVEIKWKVNILSLFDTSALLILLVLHLPF